MSEPLVPVVDPHSYAGRSPYVRKVRPYLDLTMVVAALVVTNLLAHFTTPWASIVVVPAAALGLVVLVRRRGLTWTELGLGRAHVRSGVWFALAAIGVVALVIAVGVVLPWTRPMFLNDRYATFSGALLASLVLIPLQTVIPEELAFRGVLHGALERAWGFRGVALAGSTLFGLWHVAASFGLTSTNAGLTHLFGAGVSGVVIGIIAAVIATGAAGFVFSWVRRRSGSLIAPIALHWSLNGMGALAAAVAWHVIG